MKKSILIFAAIFSFSVLFTACKETKKEDAKTESHERSSGEMVSKDVYQCPMDCEDGKTYEAKGACPVCKMDIKIVKVDADSKNPKECKCETGKCTCDKEMAKKDKECTMCKPGSCECKA